LICSDDSEPSLSPTTFIALLLNPLSTAFASDANALYFFIQLRTGRNMSNNIGETKAEPTQANAKDTHGEMPIVIAAGIAPLSSTIGIIEIKIVVK
jgi:hypothetical protein